MFRNNRVLMFGVMAMSLAITLSSPKAIAQNKDQQIVFNNRTVTLQDIGRNDTVKVTDDVSDEVMLKIGRLLRPVRIDNNNVSLEPPPYQLGSMVQKRIVEALCKSKYLKSLSLPTPTPDGDFYLGLTDIVVSPDGTVAYYNFHRSNFYVEKDRMMRSVGLESEMDKIVKESCKAIKHKFKADYLLLHIDISKIKFSLHQGVVKAVYYKP